jgi:hypothetical protein
LVASRASGAQAFAFRASAIGTRADTADFRFAVVARGSAAGARDADRATGCA